MFYHSKNIFIEYLNTISGSMQHIQLIKTFYKIIGSTFLELIFFSIYWFVIKIFIKLLKFLTIFNLKNKYEEYGPNKYFYLIKYLFLINDKTYFTKK